MAQSPRCDHRSGSMFALAALAAAAWLAPSGAWAQLAPKPIETPKPLPAPAAPREKDKPIGPRGPENTPPAPGQPTAPASAPGAPATTTRSDARDRVIRRGEAKSWTLRADIRVKGTQFYQVIGDRPISRRQDLNITSAAVVFPVVASSASHDVGLTAKQTPDVSGSLKWGSDVVDAEPVILDGYHSGTGLARWDMSAARDAREARLQVVTKLTSYNTVVNEAEARKIDWPTGAWPDVAASTFLPQLFVDPSTRAELDVILGFVERAAGKDPRSRFKPYDLAKLLTARVLEDVQISGNGLGATRAGALSYFQLRGAARTIREGRGSEFDIACVMAAVFRAAGLPARTIIGYDVYGREKETGLGRPSGGSGERFRAWIEFALVAPDDGKEIWIPVDVVRLRGAGSRARPIDQPWPFFGSHDELAYAMPIAFQFHPPTTVVAAGPMFWGWFTDPPLGGFEQSILLSSTSTAVRGGDRPRDNPRPGR